MDVTSYLLGKNVSGGGDVNCLLDCKNVRLTSNNGIKIAIIEINTIKNTSNLTDAGDMFSGCTNLTKIGIFDTSNVTSMYNMFGSCYRLKEIPQFNTSKVTNMNNMFSSCADLTTIPVFDTAKVTTMNNWFNGASNLNDNSLNNILQMCINAISYTGTKTLYQLGFRSANYSSERIQGLSNYQDFIDAGWTIGY